MSHLTRIVQHSQDIYCALGSHLGIPCYHYLRLSTRQAAALAQKADGSTVDVAQYGTVLASGYGAPNADILADIS